MPIAGGHAVINQINQSICDSLSPSESSVQHICAHDQSSDLRDVSLSCEVEFPRFCM